MPRLITSPVPEFPGTITLCDPLTLQQCYTISVAFETIKVNSEDETSTRSKKAYARSRDILDALIACSEKWEIQGQPEKPTQETFIGSPVDKTNTLLTWAFSELQKIYFGEIVVPNG